MARRRRPLDIQELRDQAAEAVERCEPIWWVHLDAPVERIFCSVGERQDVAVARVLVGDRMGFRVADTDRSDVCCVVLGCETETFAACESMMRAFVATLRANRLHGRYRQAGTDKEYKF